MSFQEWPLSKGAVKHTWAMCHMECCCMMYRRVVPSWVATMAAALCSVQYADAATGGTAISSTHSLAHACAQQQYTSLPAYMTP